jgi:mono/diheme cytochrome c family protein
MTILASIRTFLSVVACVAAVGGGAAVARDRDLGRELYGQHCAACHGANLEGAPDWQRPGPDGRFPAPPHDESGHTWHHGDRMLLEYTRLGGQAFLDARGIRFASGMPAFGDILEDAEIEAILGFIRSTWPAEIRAFQAQRTAAEGGN